MSRIPSKPKKLIGLPPTRDRSNRFVIDLPIHHKRFSPQFTGILHNLTPDGAFLETIPERPGKIIDLIFSFPGQTNQYQIAGRVMWCRSAREAKAELARPMGMGIQFLRFVRGTEQQLLDDLQAWNALRKNESLPSHLHLVDQETPPPQDQEEKPEILHIPCKFDDCEIDAVFDQFIDED